MITLIKPLLVNITILFSFTFNANLFFPFHKKQSFSIKQKLIFGLIGAIGALFCMFYPIETLGDTRFDLRMVAILIITLYVGWIPGSIVFIITSIFRYLSGGPYVSIGILVSFLAFFIALIFRRWFLQSTFRVGTGTVIVIIYFLMYIAVLYHSVKILNHNFYIVYFISFFLTFISLVFVIDHLIKINTQIEEMVYIDKLTMIGHLAASFAHEIRNPLSTVQGFIQYLSKDTTDPEFKKFSPLILEELDRTNKIITNYLQVAKPEQFHLSDIEITRVIHDCVELLRPLASYSDTTIEFSFENEHFVYGDEHHLKQAIMNVLKNGIESISDKGHIRVKVRSDYLNDLVQITVEDNGCGMTTEQLKQIGLPFYTTKTKGTGLGSMVTSKLIREMNGSIEYESEVNKGTIVHIHLPLFIKEKQQKTAKENK
ncbi:ATP-binding protein [Cytobacillus spongiae]|jgi:two-component system sporulation sensor kinase B|uniref:ATP-binding protein n=1 Tax=Cytobacillus spongiae TaxID=2901381 RepID=UPI001F1EBDF1|nr:ATP-binding protein [Cytobacillus spongiae]UII57744.1 ATP-binding protein [Cytobacillus spongiae]